MIKKTLHIASLSLFFLLVSCEDKPEEKDYVARVNDNVMSKAELLELAGDETLSNKHEVELIRNWVEDEIFYQEAEALKLLESKRYRQLMEDAEREIASVLIKENYFSTLDISYSETDLVEYYEKYKSDLRVNDDAYVFNLASFPDENSAIQFRRNNLGNEWASISSFRENYPRALEYIRDEFAYKHEIYPLAILRTLSSQLPGEVSIVLNLEPGKHTIVQLVKKIARGVIPEFENVRNLVRIRYLALKRRESFNQYFQDLYSKYNIEIKKEYE